MDIIKRLLVVHVNMIQSHLIICHLINQLLHPNNFLCRALTINQTMLTRTYIYIYSKPRNAVSRLSAPRLAKSIHLRISKLVYAKGFLLKSNHLWFTAIQNDMRSHHTSHPVGHIYLYTLSNRVRRLRIQFDDFSLYRKGINLDS